MAFWVSDTVECPRSHPHGGFFRVPFGFVRAVIAGSLGLEPRTYGLTVRCTADCATSHCPLVGVYHFTLSAQYAALIGPRAIFFWWRDLKRLRFMVVALDSPRRGLPAWFFLPTR